MAVSCEWGLTGVRDKEPSRDGPCETLRVEDLENELSLEVSPRERDLLRLLLNNFFKLPPKDLDFFKFGVSGVVDRTNSISSKTQKDSMI